MVVNSTKGWIYFEDFMLKYFRTREKATLDDLCKILSTQHFLVYGSRKIEKCEKPSHIVKTWNTIKEKTNSKLAINIINNKLGNELEQLANRVGVL